ncbi:MAG: CBS domain-containing protein [Burkholderiales bacterium]|nr:CBS domain-containing protein [Burkholderiales bacterium]
MSILDVLRGKGHTVVTVRASDTLGAAARVLAEHRIGALLVEDAWMKPAGLLSERDIVRGVAEHGPAALEFPVERLMTTRLVTCRTDDRVEDVLGAMTLARIRHVPVMEEGRVIGMVSIGDLVKHRLDEKALEANVLLDIARLHA